MACNAMRELMWLMEKATDGIFDATVPTRMIDKIWNYVLVKVPADKKVVEKRYMNWTDGTHWYEIQDQTGQSYSKAKYRRGRTHIRFEFGLMQNG